MSIFDYFIYYFSFGDDQECVADIGQECVADIGQECVADIDSDVSGYRYLKMFYVGAPILFVLGCVGFTIFKRMRKTSIKME